MNEYDFQVGDGIRTPIGCGTVANRLNDGYDVDFGDGRPEWFAASECERMDHPPQYPPGTIVRDLDKEIARIKDLEAQLDTANAELAKLRDAMDDAARHVRSARYDLCHAVSQYAAHDGVEMYLSDTTDRVFEVAVVLAAVERTLRPLDIPF